MAILHISLHTLVQHPYVYNRLSCGYVKPHNVPIPSKLLCLWVLKKSHRTRFLGGLRAHPGRPHLQQLRRTIGLDIQARMPRLNDFFVPPNTLYKIKRSNTLLL